MAAASSGDNVKIHYTGRLEDGTVFDSSEGRDPLEFSLGAGSVIPGFDKGVTGMEVGEKKTVTIPPLDAYGEAKDEMIAVINRQHIPPNITPEIGMQLEMQSPEGQQMPVTITAITEDKVTLDANHHLAGKTLIFDLELVSIN